MFILYACKVNSKVILLYAYTCMRINVTFRRVRVTIFAVEKQ